MAIVAQMPGHLPDTEEGRFQELFVDQPHEGKVLRGLPLQGVIEGRARDRQQLALLSDRQLRMIRLNHAAPHFPPQGFSFLSKKELSTAFVRSLERMAFAVSPHDLGVELFHLLLVDLGLFPTTAFEYTGGALKQSAFPLVNHRRMNPEPACLLGCGLFALQGFQGDLRLELRRVLLAFRHL